ncbi:MAG: hypothetical protein KDK78_01755 [Chlamydiia bacterium]|nr:hypothetical protein [Chlamydiia bacterium]
MDSYLSAGHFDLVTPDGVVTKLELNTNGTADASVFIDAIDSPFVAFQIDPSLISFNLKSTLAQLGVESETVDLELDAGNRCARIHIRLVPYGDIAKRTIELLRPGVRIGKLFAADDRRRVRDPDYISRMFGRSDRWGRPLLSLGGMHGSGDLILEQIDGRAVSYISLRKGCVKYTDDIYGFLPTLVRTLSKNLPSREMLVLHQQFHETLPLNVEPGEILLVRTIPLHIRTVFASVCQELLPQGFRHTSASILEPTTLASGDIYELYGESQREITDIPLEFYTLEPHREYVFFSDRDQLQSAIEDGSKIFQAFETSPAVDKEQASVFVVKGTQLFNLSPKDWIIRSPATYEFPGLGQAARHATLVERWIAQQSAYPFLKAMDDGLITSEGILLTRYFPTPLLKRMLLTDQVQRLLHGIYFLTPSSTYGGFFSQEDRALLHDLVSFAIPVYWVDRVGGKILQYVSKPGRDSGLFVPLSKVKTFLKSTVFGIYGSNLLEGDFEQELCALLKGVIEMKAEVEHPLLNAKTPLSLLTGGGPGAMEVGNRVAQKLDILSCANIVDFGSSDPKAVINEQRQNPHVEAKMTYRLDKLVERQAEFNLDFPIFLTGGIGTDFEFSLEEVRRKVGGVRATPCILFGEGDYWRQKISSRFRINRETGTIKGSEWMSNCFYAIQHAKQGLEIYRRYINGTLGIGKEGPIYDDGFVDAAKDLGIT